MKIWLWAFIGMMAMMILALLVKVHLLQKAAKEIETAFAERLITDTNTLIDISTNDPYMKSLANAINIQLRKLRGERHRYQQGDLELKEAVTNVSHDLRTPLTAISGYLELLEQEEKSETVQRYLLHIQNRTEALKWMTEELFRYSVVTSSQELKPERMDLVRALEESLLSFYAAMREKGIQPTIELPDKPVYRNLDAVAVSRVFSNIIGNAVKYSDGALSVKMEPDGRITFANPAPNLNAVSVGRLFHRFYTVEANRNATGLGLSIARTLAERMGGTIEAQYQNGWLKMTLSL